MERAPREAFPRQLLPSCPSPSKAMSNVSSITASGLSIALML